MEKLNELYEHFRSYIKEFNLGISSSCCSIQYTPLAYDFIDCDLDFDEEYYERMIVNFDKFVEIYVREMLASNIVTQATIRKNKMIFRHETELDVEKTYSKIGENRFSLNEYRTIKL